jgi:hypothetical protein
MGSVSGITRPVFDDYQPQIPKLFTVEGGVSWRRVSSEKRRSRCVKTVTMYLLEHPARHSVILSCKCLCKGREPHSFAPVRRRVNYRNNFRCSWFVRTPSPMKSPRNPVAQIEDEPHGDHPYQRAPSEVGDTEGMVEIRVMTEAIQG